MAKRRSAVSLPVCVLVLTMALPWSLGAAARAAAADPPPTGSQPDSSTEKGPKDKKDATGQAATPAPTGPAQGEAPAPDSLKIYERIDVTDRASDLVGVADSATEGVTGQTDLAQRPVLRPGEVLETVPGVMITQHSGSGKANQYYARGFNLDHGTDFRVTVDGINVNMPSHGHGQGYSDLNFLIPELVDTVRYRKGPYDARDGDFSAAGAADIEYVSALPKAIAELTPGSNGYLRTLVADSREWGGGNLLGGLELSRNNGPWVHPDDYRKLNGVLRYNEGDIANGLTVSAMGYSGRWDSTDQIAERAVTEGLISRYGSLDPSDGGDSKRFSLSADLRRGTDDSLTRVRAYGLYYDLNLFSNFTYFLDDPVHGDQFHQADRRFVTGLAVSHEWQTTWAGRSVGASVGVQARNDDIHNGLFHTEDRFLLSTTRKDHIEQVGGGPFVELRVHWNDWFRTIAGLRGDFYHANVTSNDAINSGTVTRAIGSPKLSLLFGPFDKTDFYVNAAYGFHSNDARGATITVDPTTGQPVERVQPLVRAKSLDVGLRTDLIPRVETSLSLFRLDLDSELVFSGDAGSTEPSRPTRRTGIELANFYRVSERVALDADLAYSRGRFTNFDPVGNHIPGAVEGVVSAGVTLDHFGAFFGGLRLRYFGPRPLIEDNSVRSHSSGTVNARLGYHLANGLDLRLDVFNLLNRQVSDVDYFYASRLPGEPAEGVNDVHFHPAEPREARLTADWRF
ncbi:MAG TPA: TonB-dependent receptor [Thermoanaerobaculia bacterium]|nr:TonB-dependent receptor [Thermoanaerobaculia bacterium]